MRPRRDAGQLIVGRAVQGVGAAFLVPGSLAIISASFDEAERGRAIGTWSGFTRHHGGGRSGRGRLAHRTRRLARRVLISTFRSPRPSS